MAKVVTRKNLRQFGVNGNSNNFGQFGSVVAGSPLKTKNIETIQALSAWLTGWQDAVVSANKAPFLEDENSMMYVAFWQLFYLLQEGIAEWNSLTTYFIGSLVRKADTNQIFSSLTNDNLNNALPSSGDTVNWFQVYPVRTSTLTGLILNAQIDSVAAEKITSTLVSAQIGAAEVKNANILSMDGAKLTGTVLRTRLQQIAFESLVNTTGNVTGDGTFYNVISYASTRINVNASGVWNPTTGLFTASVAGLYRFYAEVQFANVSPNARGWQALILKNVSQDGFNVNGTNGIMQSPLSNVGFVPIDSILDLAIGETASLQIYAVGTGKSVSAALKFGGYML